MKLIIAAALAASAITSIAAPALAQNYGPPPPHQGQYGPPPHQYGPPPPRAMPSGAPARWDINGRINFLHQRIIQGVRDGSLNHVEADRVQAELDNIRHEEQRDRYFRHGSLINAEVDHLSWRLDNLTRNIRWLRTNGNGPGRGW